MEVMIMALYMAVVPIVISPANIPPAAEDPLLATLANEDAYFFLSWPGAAEGNPNSTNDTERLLQDEEVKVFIAGLRKRFGPTEIKSLPGMEEGISQVVQVVQTALTHPMAVFINDVQLPLLKAEPEAVAVPGETPKIDWANARPEMGFVLHAGNDSAAVITALLYFNKEAEGEIKTEIQTDRPAADGIIIKVTIADAQHVDIFVGQKEGYLFAAVGEAALNTIVDSLKGMREAPPWYEEMDAALKIPRLTKRAFLNLSRIRTLAEKAVGPASKPFIDQLGLGRIHRLYSGAGLDDLAYTSRLFLEIDGEAVDILTFLPTKGLDANDLEMVPADVSFLVAGKTDFAEMFSQLRELLPLATQLGLPIGISNTVPQANTPDADAVVIDEKASQ